LKRKTILAIFRHKKKQLEKEAPMCTKNKWGKFCILKFSYYLVRNLKLVHCVPSEQQEMRSWAAIGGGKGNNKGLRSKPGE